MPNYLVYVYQSCGLEPFTGNTGPLSDDLLLPEPNSTKAYKLLKEELQKEGTPWNYFDGIVVALNQNKASLASTVDSEAAKAGFTHVETSDQDVAAALRNAGVHQVDDWASVLLLRKK